MSERVRATQTQYSRRLIRSFRLAAVLMGCSVFLIAEAVCALFNWGQPTDYGDPFVGFSDIHPLFVPAEDQSRFHVSPSRLDYFAPESFSLEKDAGTFRVFCLGGSTVQGRPFSTDTSFTKWLELGLSEADRRRRWEVINCGGVSYASYRLVPILQECLAYEPDLFIICTGHNEFLEDRSYDHIRDTPRLISRTHEFLGQFRTFILFRELVQQSIGRSRESLLEQRPTMPAEVRALLDYEQGVQAFHRDHGRRNRVIAHYEHNIRRMAALTTRAGVPVIFIRPPSNMADCPPFKSQHSDELTEHELLEHQRLVEQARSRCRSDIYSAIRLLRRTVAIDDQYAAAFYELGKCCEAVGQYEMAREYLLRACELDVCPLRMSPEMGRQCIDLATELNVPLIDAHELLTPPSGCGIPGGKFLVDHVHPSFEGHQRMATALIEEMARQRLVNPATGWREKVSGVWKRHFNSLDDLYCERGQRTLRTVNRWARGRLKTPAANDAGESMPRATESVRPASGGE